MIYIATFTKKIYMKEKKVLWLRQKRKCQDLKGRASTAHLMPQHCISTEESEHQLLSRKLKGAPQQGSQWLSRTLQALLSGIAGSYGSERDHRDDTQKQATTRHVSIMQPPARSLSPLIVEIGGCELNAALHLLYSPSSGCQQAPDHLLCLQTCKNRPFSDLNEDKLHIIPSE